GAATAAERRDSASEDNRREFLGVGGATSGRGNDWCLAKAGHQHVDTNCNKDCSPNGKEPTPRKSIATLWRAFNVRKDEELDARDAASTLFRFFRSNHVLDFNLIFNMALVVLVIQIILTVIAIVMGTATVAAIATAGASAAISIYGGILAWTYLSASKRLGVV